MCHPKKLNRNLLLISNDSKLLNKKVLSSTVQMWNAKENPKDIKISLIQADVCKSTNIFLISRSILKV